MVDGRIHPAESQFDGGVAGGGVHHRVRHVDGIDHVGAFREEGPGAVHLEFRIPEGRAHNDPDTVAVGLPDPDPRIVQGHTR